MKIRYIMGLVSAALVVGAQPAMSAEYLVRFKSDEPVGRQQFVRQNGGSLELVSEEGLLYKWTTSSEVDTTATWAPAVAYVQPNFTISLFQNPSLQAHRKEFLAAIRSGKLNDTRPEGDNPAVQLPAVQASGADPLVTNAWGIFTVGANLAWQKTQQGKAIVVAVTDTGVDYNHQDLIHNMWRNKGEIADNNIDDDGNGYVDDVVGWDFSSNDNKPFDLTLSLIEILMQGGNPGHGTHVSGVVGARLDNAVGVAGVAPQVKIMALRFISEKGKGSTESAIKAVDYAVKNGAHIINASWGGESGDEDDSALRESIQRAEAKGIIFVAAAGNGRLNSQTMKSEGFDNDNDPKPVVPASYKYSNMVTVAALDNADKLAPFSNWGHKTVKLGAPGVKILSTVPGNKYQDTIIDMGSMKATWDGTSMAAPFVAGALAVIWSRNPGLSMEDVKHSLLSKTHQVPALDGKVVTGGRLEMREIRP